MARALHRLHVHPEIPKGSSNGTLISSPGQSCPRPNATARLTPLGEERVYLIRPCGLFSEFPATDTHLGGLTPFSQRVVLGVCPLSTFRLPQFWLTRALT